MALSNGYNGLERRDLLLSEWRFIIYSKENSVQKLLQKFEGDPTLGSKAMALSNGYNGLERRTASSPSSDSTSTTRKTASGNYCKSLREIQRRIKSSGPFERLQWSRATRPPPHRVAIQHLLQGKQRPETTVKV